MRKILLVDDERIFHFLTSKMFEVSGITSEIHSAYDGREALTLIEEGLQPDIVFVDLDMPNMNGFQFLEAFKTKNLAGKVIVLSSSVTEDERLKSMRLGADLYMSKPLSESDIKGLFTEQ